MHSRRLEMTQLTQLVYIWQVFVLAARLLGPLFTLWSLLQLIDR